MHLAHAGGGINFDLGKIYYCINVPYLLCFHLLIEFLDMLIIRFTLSVILIIVIFLLGGISMIGNLISSCPCLI